MLFRIIFCIDPEKKSACYNFPPFFLCSWTINLMTELVLLKKLSFWPERDVIGHDGVSYPTWRCPICEFMYSVPGRLERVSCDLHLVTKASKCREFVTFPKSDGSMHLINSGSYHTTIASNLPPMVSFKQKGGLENRFWTSGYWWTSSTTTLLLRWGNRLHVVFFICSRYFISCLLTFPKLLASIYNETYIFNG